MSLLCRAFRCVTGTAMNLTGNFAYDESARAMIPAKRKRSRDHCRGSPVLVRIVLRRKCREQGETRSNLAPDNIDIAIAYPNMGGQTAQVVRRCAVEKHRRYA